MPAPHDPRYRNKPDGVLEAVAKGGPIQCATLAELLTLLATKTNYRFHVAIEVNCGIFLMTVDNEDDAQETIRRLREAPDKIQAKNGSIPGWTSDCE